MCRSLLLAIICRTVWGLAGLGAARPAWGAEEGVTQDPEWNAARAAAGDEAVRRFLALTEKYPQSQDAWFELGEARYTVQRYAEALAAFERSGALGMQPASVLLRKGKCLAKLKRFEEAEAAYREALTQAPDSAAAQFGLAAARYQLQRPLEALELFEVLAKRSDEWGEAAREYLTLCYYDTRRYVQTLELLVPRVREHPLDFQALWMLAKSEYKLKRYAEALVHFKALAAADPTRAEPARFYEAACLEGLGRVREAEKAYAAVAPGASEWAAEARKSVRNLAGRPFRATLDLLSGYDTGLVQSGDETRFTGGKDYFTQIYAQFEGRVYRGESAAVWLGVSHFGIHYAELTDNDYFEDAPNLTLDIPKVGPFAQVSLKYALSYAQLDYQPYQRSHTFQTSATYAVQPNRLRFGVEYSDNQYFRQAEGLAGPEARFYVDYKRALPLGDHELRVRANTDYRWSREDALQRFTQRVRLQYRAHVWKRLYGQLEATYRRDDFPQSKDVFDGLALRHRTDHRLTGEIRFDYQLKKYLSFNWGYTYESQDSRRKEQEFGRHQADAGFTFSF